MFVSEEFLDFGKSNILEKDIIIVFQTTYPYFLNSKPSAYPPLLIQLLLNLLSRLEIHLNLNAP